MTLITPLPLASKPLTLTASKAKHSQPVILGRPASLLISWEVWEGEAAGVGCWGRVAGGLRAPVLLLARTRNTQGSGFLAGAVTGQVPGLLF